jgi:hypothetical protein
MHVQVEMMARLGQTGVLHGVLEAQGQNFVEFSKQA